MSTRLRARAGRVGTAAVATLALATAAVGLGASSVQAADGDTWTKQVVDVVPAATTQTDVLGVMPRYTGGGQDLYLWNAAYMVHRDADGHPSWVFCIQAAVDGQAEVYTEGPGGTELAKQNLPKINRVLADTNFPKPGSLKVTSPDPEKANPAVHVLPERRVDQVEMTAVQLALWHYTDGFDFTTSNLEIVEDYYPDDYVGGGDDVTVGALVSRYNQLVAAAEANPIETPDPKLTITPEDKSGVAGDSLTFTVEGEDLDGSIAVATDDNDVPVHEVASDGTCKDAEITALPADGGEVCVVSDEEGSVTIEVEGRTAETSTHTLFAPDAQHIISTGPEKVKDEAKARWSARPTPPPPPVTPPPVTPPAEVEVLPVKQGNNAVIPQELAATGPVALETQAGLAVLALLLGAALMVATRRRELEPAPATEGANAPSAGPARLGRAWLQADAALAAAFRSALRGEERPGARTVHRHRRRH